MSKLVRLAAIASLVAVAACSGGGSYSSMPQQAMGTNFYQRAGVSPY